MNTRIRRRGLIGLVLLLAGAVAAPAAFARTHVSIGLGFYGPGYSVGINDCVNCYRRPYYPAYYSGYYPPAYYYPPAPVYYAPAYYGPPRVYYSRPYPVYGTVYYGRSYGGYHDHDHDGWHGDDQYSHDGYYHH